MRCPFFGLPQKLGGTMAILCMLPKKKVAQLYLQPILHFEPGLLFVAMEIEALCQLIFVELDRSIQLIKNF
ncbi:hypothetical protein BpHYR1_044465 [Brachionus plicatilis]|uniref:Uncharacterized protein n=1 Tax=Brachionus plicatilis TaxID=10195 RepID=A0A3M7P3Y7_BRAPC|nr:hypothetical protein BpHYR1_044465 [Brachionus plicatilis]